MRIRERINPKFARYKLRVGRSHIHRTGVFALEDIPAGKRVIEYTGKRLALIECARMKSPADRYLVMARNGQVIDGSKNGSGAELINHSCSPNLTVRGTRSRMFFFSARRIRAGEELTIRYSYPVKMTRIPCRCGSPRCRGTLRYILE